VWPRSAGCVLCALWAVPAAVWGGGYPVGVSISIGVYTILSLPILYGT